MDERIIQLLKDFKPLVIKARQENNINLPKHIEYIYNQMRPTAIGRCFGFKADTESGKYIAIYPDPEYGEYRFAHPGMFRRNDNIGFDVVHRFEDIWGLRRDSIDYWFEFIFP